MKVKENRMTSEPSTLEFTSAGPVLVRVPIAPVGVGAGADGPAVAAAAPTAGELRARIESLLGDALLMEAVALASPSTAQTCRQPLESLPPKKLRTLAASLTAYASRMRARATPFGLFAGVALAGSADSCRGELADPSRHRRVVRPDAAWLRAVVQGLERSDEGLLALEYTANPAIRREGDSLVLRTPDAGTSRISLRATPALDAVLDAAARPVPGHRTAAAAEAHCGGGDAAARLVRALVVHGLLVSELQPDPHDCDPLGHVLRRLRHRGVRTDVVSALERFEAAVSAYAAAPLGEAGSLLDLVHDAAAVAAELCGGPPGGPLGSPLQVDAVLQADIVLGPQVVAEAQSAAGVLARFATARDRQHLQRHLQQSAGGYAVPLDGIACPPLPAREPSSAPPALLAAYAAALHQGRSEIVLDDALLDAIAPAGAGDAAAELDLFAVVCAPDPAALDRGEFELQLRRPASSSAGTALARFAPALGEAGGAALRAIHGRADRAALSRLSGPAVTADTTFAPRQDAARNVARSALTRAVRIRTEGPVGGSVSTAGRDDPLTPRDLLLCAGPDGPQIWSRRLGERVLPRAATALNAEATGPHSAAVLAAATSQNTAVGFDWGALAGAPWLPRVRRGRTVYCPQTWRPGDGLVGTGAKDRAWHGRFADWCREWSVPAQVTLVDGDRQIPLRLGDPVDLALLQRQAQRGPVVLTETLSLEHCWAGSPLGAHLVEAVFPMVAATTDAAPARSGGAAGVVAPPERPLPVPQVLPGGDWLRARLSCPAGKSPRLRQEVDRTLARHRWFLTRPGPEWLEVQVHRGEQSAREWDGLLSRLAAVLVETGCGQRDDALTVLTYARDAGFGSPSVQPELLERWAMADTRCVLAALDPGAPDELLLSTLDLAREVFLACGVDPLAGVDADRRGFAPMRGRLLPLITDRSGVHGRTVPRGLRERRAAVTHEYLRLLPAPAESALAGGLLLQQHTRRLAGAEGSPGLIALAAAAELAADSWHRATARLHPVESDTWSRETA